MKRCALSRAGRAALAIAALSAGAKKSGAADTISHEVVVVVGTPGESRFQTGFNAAAEAWQDACTRAGASFTLIGPDGAGDIASDHRADGPSDRDAIQARITALDSKTAAPFWFVFIGHGTFDGKQAYLNLRGPDVAAEELADWLKPVRERPLVILHGGSASGPFVPALSGPNRIVITGTRSGEEINYARFAERLASEVASADADIDRDGRTSLLEAALSAAQRVRAEYAEANRLVTEHALIDDNGDKLGTPAEWFEGTRVVRRPVNGGAVDGFRAHQIALLSSDIDQALTPDQRRARDQWEAELEKLRARRSSLTEADYLRELEAILQTLAPLYLPRRNNDTR